MIFIFVTGKLEWHSRLSITTVIDGGFLNYNKNKLGYYLDEYVFRYNRRTSNSRGLLFMRLLEQAVITGPVTYDRIIKENHG